MPPRAARPTWQGHLRLSLVTCPVAPYPATLAEPVFGVERDLKQAVDEQASASFEARG